MKFFEVKHFRLTTKVTNFFIKNKLFELDYFPNFGLRDFHFLIELKNLFQESCAFSPFLFTTPMASCI